MSNNTRIIRGDEELKLYPDEVIAQTLQGPNIGDLITRGFNFTNTFKIPAKPNAEAYENANKINSESDAPYTQEVIKVIQNGIEIESNGREKIVSSSDEDYDIIIRSGAVAFFDAVGDKMLSDLDDFVIEAGDTQQTALRATTSGVIYPVADYGDSELVGWPFIYDISILNNIISMAGYTGAGSIFSNTKFIKQTTGAFSSQTGYVSSFIDSRRVSVSVVTPQNIVATGGVQTNVQFTGVSEGGTNPFGYWDGVDQYVINDPRISAGQAIFAATIKIIVNVSAASETFSLIIPAPGLGSAISLGSGLSAGTYSFETTGVFDMIPTKGSDISLKFIFSGSAPGNTATISYGSMIIEPVSSPISYLFGTSGTYSGFLFDDISGLLPDIKQKDFIKDIMICYGLIATEKNGVITFTSFDEIIADRGSALDWTNKRVPDIVRDKMTYTPYSYGQRNIFKYTNVDDLVSTNYGMGVFEIDNDNIKDVIDPFYKSIYAAARTSFVSNLITASLELIDGSGVSFPNIMNKASNRKLLIRSMYPFEPAVTYMDGVPYSDYKVAYFDDPAQSDSMKLQQYLDEEYPLFVEALQKAKVAQWYYNLTEVDVSGFDFLKLIFDKDTYFLVNRINNFVPGVKTLVNQFKV